MIDWPELNPDGVLLVCLTGLCAVVVWVALVGLIRAVDNPPDHPHNQP